MKVVKTCCGEIEDVTDINIKEDELGLCYECKQCDSTCDVDIISDTVFEVCPHCDNEVEIPNTRVSSCPPCTCNIKPCAMCDMYKVDCNNCPWDLI